MAKKLTAAQLADSMAVVREEIDHLEAIYKKASAELLLMLQAEGRSHEGVFTVAKGRKTLEIVDEKRAIEWAKEHNVFTIDKSKAIQVLRRELQMPDFFTVKTAPDYIRISTRPQE